MTAASAALVARLRGLYEIAHAPVSMTSQTEADARGLLLCTLTDPTRAYAH